MENAKDMLIKRTIANVTKAQTEFNDLHPETHNHGAIIEDLKIMEAMKIINSAVATSLVDSIHHAWFKDVLKRLKSLE